MAKNYAHIINGVAVNVSASPVTDFHPSIAALFVEVPANVGLQWRNVDGEWLPPPQIETPVAPVPVPPKVSPVEFLLLFTFAERVAIKAARATDPLVDDLFSLVEDPRLTFVNLALQSTQDALSYLASKTLITAVRIPEILTGQIK